MRTSVICILASVLFVAVVAEEAEEAPAAEATDEAASGEAAENVEELTDEQKIERVSSQGKELVEKLGHLKELIAAKGDGVNSGELESLKKLEKMLGDLGMGGSNVQAQAGKDAEVTRFFQACTMMSMARAGSRANTMGSLRRMADDKLTPEEASSSDFWQMTVSCLTRLTDDEFDRFKAGTLKQLPKEYVDAAKLPEAKAEVLNVDLGHWAELKVVALSIVGDKPEPAGIPPISYIALVIVLAVFIFLGKKFMDMLNEKDESKASKKEKKAAKKGQ